LPSAFFVELLNFVNPDHQASSNRSTFTRFAAFEVVNEPVEANTVSVVIVMTVVIVHDRAKSESLRIAGSFIFRSLAGAILVPQ
jgi:hypothetical protein